MRLIPIRQCRPGMRLGKSIHNEEGLVLLGVHKELTEPLIQRLSSYGIENLYVEDARTDDVDIQGLVSDETRLRATSVIRNSFRKIMDESVRPRGGHKLFIGEEFRSVMTDILDELLANKKAMIMMVHVGASDQYLYEHSLNVCIYATMLGIADGYNRDQLMTLGLGALLHDIGKTKVPNHILQKPSKLTVEEFEEVKRHTEYGFKMLKDEPNMPLIAAHCAFQHHERMDGTGYPRGIAGKDIHHYARWLGLVDTYDALTSRRVYRPAMLPHQALEVLYAGAGTLYDIEKVKVFRDKVALYPLGVTVKLSSGESGIVIDINSSLPQRPIVRILQDAEGQDVTQPYEIDLSKKLSLAVMSVNDILVEPQS